MNSKYFQKLFILAGAISLFGFGLGFGLGLIFKNEEIPARLRTNNAKISSVVLLDSLNRQLVTYVWTSCMGISGFQMQNALTSGNLNWLPGGSAIDSDINQ